MRPCGFRSPTTGQEAGQQGTFLSNACPTLDRGTDRRARPYPKTRAPIPPGTAPKSPNGTTSADPLEQPATCKNVNHPPPGQDPSPKRPGLKSD